jgi:release factor glutamine methyltransferase
MSTADTVAGLLAAAHGVARLDAELLLAHVCGLRRSTLRAFPERPVGAAAASAFRRVVERRASGEPLAYITGTKEFYGLSLHVTPDVLVPRPETELLVDALLERMPAGRSVRVLDLGTGSGALALALKHERPGWDVAAVDVSAAALAVARRNGERLALAVRWLVSDGFAAFAASASGERFDAIVVNPPYVRSDDPALEAELEVEPRTALDGGADGCDAYRALFGAAPRHLAADGLLLAEHGSAQRAAVVEIAAANGLELVAGLADLAGHDRAVVLRPHAPAATPSWARP